MRFAGATLMAAAIVGLSQLPVASAQAPPQIPGTYYGSATMDGKMPPAGTAVRGLIDGMDCTQPGAMGTVDAGDVGAYVISVMHESQKPGCGREGKRVTFTIGGREAGQSADWGAGPQPLDLNAGVGEPQPLPSDVAIPGGDSDAAARTTDAASVDDSEQPRGATPLPPGVSVEDGGGANLGAVFVGGLGVLAMTGAAVGWVLSRRRRPGGAVQDMPQDRGDQD